MASAARIAAGSALGRHERVEAEQGRRASASGIAGRVTTSGRSRWSRSVASRSVRATKNAPKRSSGTRLVEAQRSGAPRDAAPEDRDDRRAPVRPGGPSRPDGRSAPSSSTLGLVLRPAGGDPVGDEAPGGAGDARATDEPVSRAVTGSAHDRPPAASPAYAGRAPARASSTSVAVEAPVAPRARPRRGLAEVGRPGDVEMDPRHGHELAQEEGAPDQAALGRRAGVRHVGVPALHLGPVLLDERQLPEALAGPGGGGGDLVVPGLRGPEPAR